MRSQHKRHCSCFGCPSKNFLIALSDCHVDWELETAATDHEITHELLLRSIFSTVNQDEFAVRTESGESAENSSMKAVALSKHSQARKSATPLPILMLLAPEVLPSSLSRSVNSEQYREASGVEEVMAVNSIFQNYLIADGYLRNVGTDKGRLRIVLQHFSLHIGDPVSAERRPNILIIDQEERELPYDQPTFISELTKLCKRIHSAETLRRLLAGQFEVPEQHPDDRQNTWTVKLLRTAKFLIEKYSLDVVLFDINELIWSETPDRIPGLIGKLNRLGLIQSEMGKIEVVTISGAKKSIAEVLLKQIFLRILAQDQTLERCELGFLKTFVNSRQYSSTLLNKQRMCLLLRIIQKARREEVTASQRNLASRALEFMGICLDLVQNIDLSNLHLPNCDLRSFNFYNCDFTNSTFKGSRIDEHTNFIACTSITFMDELDTTNVNKPSSISRPQINGNRVICIQDQKINSYNLTTGEIVNSFSGEITRSYGRVNSEYLRLPVFIETYNGLKIHDIASGNILQAYQPMTNSLRTAIHGHTVYGINQRAYGSGVKLQIVDLATSEVRNIQEGLQHLRSQDCEGTFNQEGCYIWCQKVEAAFRYDVHTSSLKRLRSINGRVKSEKGWLVCQFQKEEVQFRKEASEQSWKLVSPDRITKVNVICAQPLVAIIVLDNAMTRIVNVQSDSILYEYNRSSNSYWVVADCTMGEKWEDIVWYEIEAGKDRLFKHRKIELHPTARRFNNPTVNTFLQKAFSFETIGPIKLIRSPNRILWVCDSTAEVHTLVEQSEKALATITYDQNKTILVVGRPELIQIYKITAQGLKPFHTIGEKDFSNICDSKSGFYVQLLSKEIKVINESLLFLKLNHKSSYITFEALVILNEDSTMTTHLINSSGSSSLQFAAVTKEEGILCFKIESDTLSVITTDGSSRTIGNSIINHHYSIEKIEYLENCRLLVTCQDEEQYEFDVKEVLQTVRREISLGYVTWDNATYVERNGRILLEKDNYLYLCEQPSQPPTRIAESQHPDIVYSEFISEHKQHYSIRQGEDGGHILEIVDVLSKKLTAHELKDFPSPIVSITMLHQLLLISDTHNSLHVYRGPNWKSKVFRCRSNIKLCLQSQNQPSLFYLLDHLSRLSCLNIETEQHRQIKTISRTRIIQACSHTKYKLYYLNGTGNIYVFDSRTQESKSYPILHEQFITIMAMVEDSQTLYYTYRSNHLIGMNLQTGQLILSMKAFDRIRSLQLLDDELIVYDTNDSEGTLSYYQTNRWRNQNKDSQDADQFLNVLAYREINSSRLLRINLREQMGSSECLHSLEFGIHHEVDWVSRLKLTKFTKGRKS